MTTTTAAAQQFPTITFSPTINDDNEESSIADTEILAITLVSMFGMGMAIFLCCVSATGDDNNNNNNRSSTCSKCCECCECCGACDCSNECGDCGDCGAGCCCCLLDVLTSG